MDNTYEECLSSFEVSTDITLTLTVHIVSFKPIGEPLREIIIHMPLCLATVDKGVIGGRHLSDEKKSIG